MDGDREARIRRLREAILEHVLRHPEASDTPQGILAWWLADGCFEDAPGLIDETLSVLANEGLLRRLRLPDGGTLYAAGNAQGIAGNDGDTES